MVYAVWGIGCRLLCSLGCIHVDMTLAFLGRPEVASKRCDNILAHAGQLTSP